MTDHNLHEALRAEAVTAIRQMINGEIPADPVRYQVARGSGKPTDTPKF